MTNLYEVKHQLSDSHVHAWEFISLGVWNNHRLYYKAVDPIDKESSSTNQGFYFYVLSFNNGPAIRDGKADIWSRQTEVDIMMSGQAYWDGLRHVNVGQYDEGYLNYPNAILMIEIWDNLRQLEEKYCLENDGNKY
jgi:hypothetical protein